MTSLSAPAARSRRLTRAAAAALGLILGGFGSVEITTPAAGGFAAPALSFGAPSAQAHPYGVARRTTRRIVRRNAAYAAYRTHVRGCYYAAPYYRCAGVYYRPVIRHGVTVYVVAY